MSQGDSVLKQLLSFVQEYEFAALTTMRHPGQKFRFSNCWSRFSALLIGQLAGRQSLRDIPTILWNKASGSLSSA
jgi:hypothetical protein